jgi:hypothetical protein
MDEIFGYFPPVANPPSKLPLLTLLKQARAFGVGVVLATQNPVDLDYKGLSNAGTWFIGRLQTERDKARVLEGLEGAAAGAGSRFDRGQMEEILAGLGNRIFLMNNVHDDAPEVFETRWAMSYLRGPLTRGQIKTLMSGRSAGAPAPPQAAREAASAPAAVAAAAAAAGRPVLPPDVPQHFIPVRGTAAAGTSLVYQPMLFGAAEIRFADTKKGFDTSEPVAVMTAVTTEAVAVDWERAEEVSLAASDLESSPQAGARFAELPPAAGKPKSYDAWKKELGACLFRTRTIELFTCPRLRAFSKPGEAEGDFRARLQHAGREKRDQSVEQLRKKYAPKIASLQEKIRRAEQAVERESEQATQQGLQAAISIGTTLIGAMLGRKVASTATLGRATTAARGAGRVLKERQDVGRAKETMQAPQQQLADLEDAFKAETDTLGASGDGLAEPIETLRVRPTKQNVTVKLVALAWAPVWQDGAGGGTPAWQ